MAPIPPYDVIIFIVVWLISIASWLLTWFFRVRGTCCTYMADSNLCGQLCGDVNVNNGDDSAQSLTKNPPPGGPLHDGQQEEMRNSGDAAIHVLATEQQQGSNNKTADGVGASPSSSSPQRTIIRIVLMIVLTFLIAFILTIIIMAILAGVGFLDALLFSPAAASTCTPSCTYTTKDGLSGWVDDSCCTYSPVGLGTYSDLHLKFRVTGTSTTTGYNIHGWLMINSTKHHSAPADQKPLLLLYNHGSGSNVAAGYRIERYKFLLEQGNIALLSYDYPGYGKSTGTASVSSVMESARNVAQFMEQYLESITDLSAVTMNATSSTSGINVGTEIPVGASLTDPLIVDVRANGVGANLSSIVVLGRSMGGGVSTYTVKTALAKPKAMILQSTFAELTALTSYYFPMFYWVWDSTANADYSEFSNVVNIKSFSNGCLYQSHSRDDEWVPFEDNAVKIHEAAAGVENAACSKWVVVDSALHTQPLTNLERTELDAFLKQGSVRRN